MSGRRRTARFEPTLLNSFRTFSDGQNAPFTCFVQNGRFGRKSRCSTPSRIPARCRLDYLATRMYRHDVGRQALANPALLEAVVRHKRAFFREAAARYDLAVPGSLKIVP